MHRYFCFFLFFLLASVATSQPYLGWFEAGERVPLLLVSADPFTHEPTDPVDLTYSILKNSSVVASGTMTVLQTGVAAASHSTVGEASGVYHVLYAGLIGGVTTRAMQTYSLFEPGKGIAGIVAEVSGLNGISPLSMTDFLPYHENLSSWVGHVAENVTTELLPVLERNWKETQVASRELSRARIWFAQSTIDTLMRKVPADRPSHVEIQLASPDDIAFSTPTETFYRIYAYPNALGSTKASSEIRSTTPPCDGVFYRMPDFDWE